MQYHFLIHRDRKGYWAECSELAGCVTQGKNLPELRKNAKEALDLFLSEPEESGQVFPLPNPKRRESARRGLFISPEPSVAFSVLLKSLRANRKLTQAAAAKLLGMKSLWTYQKLESAKTANPELKTLARLKQTFPEFRIDDLFGEQT